MEHFAGLDVSVKETSVCIVDDTGRIVREVKVASEPEALLQVLRNPAYHFKRIGLEAGPLSQWLFSALADAGLPVICVETRHMRAVLKAQINKTDRNDARGMAQMMRAGLYRPVHVKTLRSQKLRMLLTHRKLLQSKAIAIENDLRGTLRNFGLKVGIVGKLQFEARIRELVENLPDLAAMVEPLLIVRRTLREQLGILHRRLLAIVRDDDVCRRLMTIPGVGPVVALTYRATVDVPARFRNSKAVGAVFGLTCAKYQAGEVDWSGRISRCGDEMMRVMLYEAAQAIMPRYPGGRKLKATDVIDVLADLFNCVGFQRTSVPITARSSWQRHFGNGLRPSELRPPISNLAAPGRMATANPSTEKLRDELLNGEIFYTLNEAKIVIETWRRHYNTVRPHSSLAYRPPAPEVIAWPTVKPVAPMQTLN